MHATGQLTNRLYAVPGDHAGLARKAIKHIFFGADRERRRLLGVERTQTGEVAADAVQRDVVTCERDEVRDFSDSRHILVEDSHWLSAQSRRPRGRSSGRQPSSSTPRPNV